MRGPVGLAVTLLLVSCGQQMDDQPKYETFEPAAPGRAAAWQPVEGTVPRGWLPRPVAETVPLPVTPALLARGRERFTIYCAPCHSPLGDGDGIIVRRGFPAPPSYHTARLRAASDRHFYEVITDGYGAMAPYAARVPPGDRWAIVAYIRALQLSQHAPAELAPSLTPPDDSR